MSDELFDEVQEIVGQKKRGHRPATEDYLLTGKLFCGHCKDQMTGTSGTSKTGITHRYYKCVNGPKDCDKKTVRKDFIEPLIVETCRQMLSYEIIDEIVEAVIDQNRLDQESSLIINLRSEISDIEAKIERLIDQIEDGGSVRLADRLKKREEELESLQKQLMREQAKQNHLDPEIAREFLEGLRDARLDNENYRKLLIRSFIDRIYLYDDHFRILFNNGSKRGKTSKREAADVERYFDSLSSETTLYAPPSKRRGLRPLRFDIAET